MGKGEGWQVPSRRAQEKGDRVEGQARILPLLEDGDVFARAFPYVTTAGFTVTERVSFAVTVMPQAPPLDVRT